LKIEICCLTAYQMIDIKYHMIDLFD